MTCDMNRDALRFEVYDHGGETYIGCADTVEEAREYEPCCDGDVVIVDTDHGEIVRHDSIR